MELPTVRRFPIYKWQTKNLKSNTDNFLFTAQPSEFWFSQAGKWEMRSTGLYAKAGSKVAYTIPQSAVGTIHVSMIFKMYS